MSLINTVPAGFPLVGLAISSTFILNVYQTLKVSAARKESGVMYPNLYASDADAKADPKKMKFNCVQRAHANTLESLPFILSMTGFLGLYHPKFAAACTMLWVIGRFGYTAGYSTGVPKKRTNPISLFQYPGLLGLFFGSLGVSAYKTYQYFL